MKGWRCGSKVRPLDNADVASPIVFERPVAITDAVWPDHGRHRSDLCTQVKDGEFVNQETVHFQLVSSRPHRPFRRMDRVYSAKRSKSGIIFSQHATKWTKHTIRYGQCTPETAAETTSETA